jgi:hypothetical protein
MDVLRFRVVEFIQDLNGSHVIFPRTPSARTAVLVTSIRENEIAVESSGDSEDGFVYLVLGFPFCQFALCCSALLRHISSFCFLPFDFLEVVNGRENVMMDVMESRCHKPQEAGHLHVKCG